jgi:hypothetical protein
VVLSPGILLSILGAGGSPFPSVGVYMDSKDALMLLREIRDLLQVLLVQQSPGLAKMLRAVPSPSRPSQSWSACGHGPEEDFDMDGDGQV